MVKDFLLQDFKSIALAAQKVISKSGNSLGPKFNLVKIYLNPEHFRMSEFNHIREINVEQRTKLALSYF